MKIFYIQGEWDKRKGRGKYFGDQDYLEISVDAEELDDIKGSDKRIPHTDDDKPYDFWVHRYPDDSLISFMHHNSINLGICDNHSVEHFNHDGCGYAGHVFDYVIDGIEYKVRGGWSSNEHHYRDVTGEMYMSCSVKDRSRDYALWGGLSVPVSFVLQQIKDQNLPYSLVVGLGVDKYNPDIIHNDDVEDFIKQGGMWNPDGYRGGTKWARQYSDITPPNKYRVDYINDDIANATVLTLDNFMKGGDN